jgi:hypothetical protein
VKENALFKLVVVAKHLDGFHLARMLASGELTQLIEEDGQRGATSNHPSLKRPLRAVTITTTQSASWPSKARLVI